MSRSTDIEQIRDDVESLKNIVAQASEAPPLRPITGPRVYAAIANVASDLSRDGIEKSRENKQQGWKFRGIDDMYNAISGLLAKHGLAIIPRVLTREQVERTTKSGGSLFWAFVDVEFDFVSVEDGSKHTAKTFGEALDTGDKSTNKAMSAAYKYVVMQTFCIPTEGDNDADSTTHEVAPRAPAQANTAKSLTNSPQTGFDRKPGFPLKDVAPKEEPKVPPQAEKSAEDTAPEFMTPAQSASIKGLTKAQQIATTDLAKMAREHISKDLPSANVKWTFDDAEGFIELLEKRGEELHGGGQ